jgi:hypothetical protein
MTRRAASRAFAALLAAVPLVTGAFLLLLTLLFSGLQCDESCTGDDWHHTASAWQWSVYPALGAIVFLAGVMTFVFVCRRGPGGAFASLALGTVVFFSGLAWSGDNSWRFHVQASPQVSGRGAAVDDRSQGLSLGHVPTRR